MNCQEVQKLLLSDFLDGEAPVEVSCQIEKHLAGCPFCKDYYEKVFKETEASIAIAAQRKVPSLIWKNVEACIENKQARKTSKKGKGFLKLPFLLEKIDFPAYKHKKASAFISAGFFILIMAWFVFFQGQKVEYSSTFELQKAEEFHYIFSRTRVDLFEKEQGFSTSIEEAFL